jgi:hypothetical protein
MSQPTNSKRKTKNSGAFVIGCIVTATFGLGSAVLAQVLVNNFDYGTLKIAQNLPSGKWKQVTHSSVVIANTGAIDREEIGCVSADDIQQGLRGMAMSSEAFSGNEQGSCPVRVDSDTPTSAQVTSICPSTITLVPLNVPVTFRRNGASQPIVVESCEVTPQGTKFVRSEFTYLGQCDGSAPSVRAIPRLAAPYRCGQASTGAPQAIPSPKKARPKKK